MRPEVSEDLAGIMRAGILAPSADNRHCFQFALLPDGVGLFGTDEYVRAPLHRKVLHRIGLGAVAENMVVRAARLGYRAELAWLPDTGVPSLIARLRLERDEPRDTGLDAAIERRHTNRTVMFSGPRLGADELVRFSALIADIEGVSLSFFDSGWRRRELLRLVLRAEEERFAVRSLHADLFSAVRFDVGWRATVEEGLAPGALGVEPGMRWAFSQLRRWPVMRLLNAIGVHRLLGLRAACLPCLLAPHRGVLTTRLPLEQGTVAIGRALERIWLEAERRGLAFQPLAGAALLALPDYEAVRRSTRERLRKGWRLLTDATPLMVFRIGRSAAPLIRTGRPTWVRCVRAAEDMATPRGARPATVEDLWLGPR